MFRSFAITAALAGLGTALLAAGPAHAVQKAVFFIDVEGIYQSLATSFGAPFEANGDLDGVDGPDATQANVVLFNQIAQNISSPDHDPLHDAWIDNFLIARNIMRDETALSNAVIDNIAAIIGLFMAIQTHEMEHAMEDLWEDDLGITDPDFDSLPWVQAPVFAHGHHDDDDHHHHGDDDDHHGHHDDDDHHGHHDDDDHHHSHADASGIIKYFHPIGGNLFVRIPGSVDTSQPIQWYHNGVAMQDYLGLILGTQSRELELWALEPGQSGTYTATYTMGAGHHDDDDHHHHGDDDDHHGHDDDDHHHHGDDDDHHGHSHDKSFSDKGFNKSNATFSFTIQVVDPESLPVSRPYALIALMVLLAVGGTVLYRRKSLA